MYADGERVGSYALCRFAPPLLQFIRQHTFAMFIRRQPEVFPHLLDEPVTDFSR